MHEHDIQKKTRVFSNFEKNKLLSEKGKNLTILYAGLLYAPKKVLSAKVSLKNVGFRTKINLRLKKQKKLRQFQNYLEKVSVSQSKKCWA